MKVRIGLVGPADSLDRIQQSADRIRDSAILVPRVYRAKEESPRLAAELDPDVDVILFSGIVPYRIAALAGVTTKPLLYLPRLGMSLAQPLWEMREKGLPFNRISIDSFAARDVAEVAEELGFQFETVEIVEHWETASYEDLASAHEKLYREGRTDLAFTGLSRTVELLMEHHVPCKRIYPTRYTIREYLEKAAYIGQNNRLKAYQLAVLILRLRPVSASVSMEYDYLRVRNTFEGFLIDYARGVFGSLFPYGHDEYLVFTTRGSTEEPYWIATLNSAAERAGIAFYAGLGYGTTAYNAEANARKALDRSSASTGSCVFSVDVDGEIKGPLSNAAASSYNIAETDALLVEAAAATGMSAAHLSKIRSMVRRAGKRRFDVDEFASGLNISPRSARRILQDLSDSGLATIVGHESKRHAGRPRRLFEITL
ncbi:MAG: hypothetical protein JXM71_02345 [Spirochaetales bacterium]|nr:hypothetical protein [Spirochaetales bacterium]